MPRYAQPRAVNGVSLTLLGLALVAGYTAHAAWPIFALDLRLKSALDGAVPRLYRANLLPEPEASVGAEETRQALTEQLTHLGVGEPEHALTFIRTPETIAVGVTVPVALDLKLFHLHLPFTLTPHVETSARRGND